MAHIDVRGPWPVYINGNFAREIHEMFDEKKGEWVPATRSITVEQAEVVIQLQDEGKRGR